MSNRRSTSKHSRNSRDNSSDDETPRASSNSNNNININEAKLVSKSEAAANVLIAITLQIRARQDDLISGKKPLVISEKVVSLIERARRSYVKMLEQQAALLEYQRQVKLAQQQSIVSRSSQQQQNNTTSNALPPPPPPAAVSVRKLVPPEVTVALLEELRKVTFLVVLGRIQKANLLDQAREDEDQQRRALAQRKRAQEHFLGMPHHHGGGGDHSGGHAGHHGSPFRHHGDQQGKTLSFQSFPNLLNIALFECHVRRLDHISKTARFTAVGTDLPPTVAMPLIGVFAALRHVECDLELGVISPVVEQLSSFCFSLRSVTITIKETAGVAAALSGDRQAINAAATAVTMNRRLFADVWRPKGAQIKMLGASQKAAAAAAAAVAAAAASSSSAASATSGGATNNNNNNGADGGGGGGGTENGAPGFWEALSVVKIRGELNRRREGRSMAIVMLDDSWKTLRLVTSLQLRGLRFSSFMELVPLAALHLLRAIDLGDNAFTTLAGISEALPRRSLRTIVLDSNRIAGGLAELNAMPVTNLDLSVNQLSQWTDLQALGASPTLRSVDLRANHLDARSADQQQRDRVVVAEDIVSMILRTMNGSPSLQSVNGFLITSAVRAAAETDRIQRSVAAILAHEKALEKHLTARGLATKDDVEAKKGGLYGQSVGGEGVDGGYTNSNSNNNNNNNNNGNNNPRSSGATGRGGDDDDDTESIAGQSTITGTRRTKTVTKSGKRVIIKTVPTRLVSLGDGTGGPRRESTAGGGGGGGGTSGAGSKAILDLQQRNKDNNNNPGSVTSTGLDYLRATFGEQYIMHLPQHDYGQYVDPNDPDNVASRTLSYEKQRGDVGVAALLGLALSATEAVAAGGKGGAGALPADSMAAAPASTQVLALRRAALYTPVQPVFDQFLSELRKHEWYPSATTTTTTTTAAITDSKNPKQQQQQLQQQQAKLSTAGAAPTSDSRLKVFPLGCETMFNSITFENACFWEVQLLPTSKQTQSQPYAVHPDGREIVLVNGDADKSSKQNESHSRYARKVLFRIVETQVGFARHIKLEERNLSGVPPNFFAQSARRLAELAASAQSRDGGGFNAAGRPSQASASAASSAASPGISSASFASSNATPVIREKPPKLETLATPGQGLTKDQIESIPSFSGRYPIFSCVLPSDDHSPPVQITPKFLPVQKTIRTSGFAGGGEGTGAAPGKSFVVLEDAATNANMSAIQGGASSPAAQLAAGGKKALAQEISPDEMMELMRQRVFGTSETVLLAGFVVPARIAAEFKRKLVQQLKTAAAKLSIQGVFREWPFILRGEGTGEQRDASLPIEPTGKYVHDRLQHCSMLMDSLSRQRINNGVGCDDHELSLRLRRFVFEKHKKYSTEPIPEFDFLSFFNATSPDSVMWLPQSERSLIVGIAGPCMYVAENHNTLGSDGTTTAQTPEEHFTTPRRYDLVHLRAIVCSFDLATIRLIFGGVDARRVRDLQLLSREPSLSFQLLATLQRLRFLPESSACVAPFMELPKIVNVIHDTAPQQATAQIYFRPSSIGRFTVAPFIYSAHVFVRTNEPADSKNPAVANPNIYPMRCTSQGLSAGWACARLVITLKDIRLVEVREMVSVDPEQAFNRSKKSLEEPFSLDVQQPSQLLRCELAPAALFPLLFGLVFSCPSAPSKEAHWILCAPHPATLFTIKRELRNVQGNLVVSEMDMDVLDDTHGFPLPTAADRTREAERAAASAAGGASPLQGRLGSNPSVASSPSVSSPRGGGAAASAGSPPNTARARREGSPL